MPGPLGPQNHTERWLEQPRADHHTAVDDTKPSLSSNNGGILCCPSQMDCYARTSKRAMRQSPLRLFIEDTRTLISVLPYLPHTVLPFKTSNSHAELYLNLASALSMAAQSWLFILEVFMLLLAVPALLVLPFSIFVLVAAIPCTWIYIIAWPFQGPRVCYSTMDNETTARADQYSSERWLYVNGCATDHSILQKNIDRLSKTFGRVVIGIHNKTYGLPADILECLIQRCLYFKSMDVRVAYAHIKSFVVDPSVTKVVLIGHSQGGIIISLALDQLFSELSTEMMSKLEVYTFGSAASHFSNPLRSLSATFDRESVPPPKVHFEESVPAVQNVIQHIEHYANELDMIPRWGVLHCVREILENRYAGSVFVRIGASGHFLNQHYLDPMFPLHSPQLRGTLPLLIDTFLDKIVQNDEILTTKREAFGLGNPSVAQNPPTNGEESHQVLIFSRTSSGIVVGKETKGRTVREVSRLWKYQDGRSPDENGDEDETLSQSDELKGE